MACLWAACSSVSLPPAWAGGKGKNRQPEGKLFQGRHDCSGIALYAHLSKHPNSMTCDVARKVTCMAKLSQAV